MKHAPIVCQFHSICIWQTLPALPTTLLMLIVDPMPVAIAAAVVVVLLAILVAVDDTDVAVALVKVANVVAADSIVVPDIVPMSIPGMSMLTLRLRYRNQEKGALQKVGFMIRRLRSIQTGGIKVKKRREWSDCIEGVQAGACGEFWSV